MKDGLGEELITMQELALNFASKELNPYMQKWDNEVQLFNYPLFKVVTFFCKDFYKKHELKNGFFFTKLLIYFLSIGGDLVKANLNLLMTHV